MNESRFGDGETIFLSTWFFWREPLFFKMWGLGSIFEETSEDTYLWFMIKLMNYTISCKLLWEKGQFLENSTLKESGKVTGKCKPRGKIQLKELLAGELPALLHPVYFSIFIQWPYKGQVKNDMEPLQLFGPLWPFMAVDSCVTRCVPVLSFLPLHSLPLAKNHYTMKTCLSYATLLFPVQSVSCRSMTFLFELSTLDGAVMNSLCLAWCMYRN